MNPMEEESRLYEKRLVGEYAADYIKDGMKLGLGTGSTVYYTILKLGEMVEQGLKVKAVSTSSSTTSLAKKLGIELVTLEDVTELDLTIDGADEVDPQLNGIKGGGGALLFEKVVAYNSKRNIWVIDSKKYVQKLGGFRLPVEVVPFAMAPVLRKLEEEKFSAVIRVKDDSIYHTDSGNVILDVNILHVVDYRKLNEWLLNIPGVVETGLFMDVVDEVIMPDRTRQNGITCYKREKL